jgi:hypothetical protein
MILGITTDHFNSQIHCLQESYGRVWEWSSLTALAPSTRLWSDSPDQSGRIPPGPCRLCARNFRLVQFSFGWCHRVQTHSLLCTFSRSARRTELSERKVSYHTELQLDIRTGAFWRLLWGRSAPTSCSVEAWLPAAQFLGHMWQLDAAGRRERHGWVLQCGLSRRTRKRVEESLQGHRQAPCLATRRLQGLRVHEGLCSAHVTPSGTMLCIQMHSYDILMFHSNFKGRHFVAQGNTFMKGSPVPTVRRFHLTRGTLSVVFLILSSHAQELWTNDVTHVSHWHFSLRPVVQTDLGG